MRKKILHRAVPAMCTFVAMLLSGCYYHTTLDYGYPNGEKYSVGAFTYRADEIQAIAVDWYSGAVEIVESDSAELHAQESGTDLPEEAAMHYLLEDGVLRVRFCASGAKIRVKAENKQLRLEVPKGVKLSVSVTSASVRAETLGQDEIKIEAHSGSTELGTVTANKADLSSSSGAIHAGSISVQELRCSASSGSMEMESISAKDFACEASSGSVTVGKLTSDTVQVTTSSGSVRLTLAGAPTAQIRTSSGSVRLTLDKSGAQVAYTSSSGRLHTDCPYTWENGLYVFGDGEGSITVRTSSGNLRVQ